MHEAMLLLPEFNKKPFLAPSYNFENNRFIHFTMKKRDPLALGKSTRPEAYKAFH